MAKWVHIIYQRSSFAKELYLWGWRWVVFVILGFPYGVASIYDFLQGQGFLPNDSPVMSTLVPSWLPPVWLIAGVVVIIVVTFEGAYRIKKQRTPSEGEVNDAILLLEAETLVVKGKRRKRSYSFAQVFLAIADQLSIGVKLGSFAYQIQEVLGLGADKGWFIPKSVITHLIGMLDQNAIVDCRHEEYQHMVGGITYASTAISFPPPKEHLSKGTEMKYYLSPLGRRVIQQLRQQSTAHKEGSQTE